VGHPPPPVLKIFLSCSYCADISIPSLSYVNLSCRIGRGGHGRTRSSLGWTSSGDSGPYLWRPLSVIFNQSQRLPLVCRGGGVFGVLPREYGDEECCYYDVPRQGPSTLLLSFFSVDSLWFTRLMIGPFPSFFSSPVYVCSILPDRFRPRGNERTRAGTRSRSEGKQTRASLRRKNLRKTIKVSLSTLSLTSTFQSDPSRRRLISRHRLNSRLFPPPV
jgi:hypothetical protein